MALLNNQQGVAPRDLNTYNDFDTNTGSSREIQWRVSQLHALVYWPLKVQDAAAAGLWCVAALCGAAQQLGHAARLSWANC